MYGKLLGGGPGGKAPQPPLLRSPCQYITLATPVFQVKFSVMKPGTHIWAHCGPTNCRIRGHLGLVIPDGVSIRVNQTTRLVELSD
jgi:hypothetical protein